MLATAAPETQSSRARLVLRVCLLGSFEAAVRTSDAQKPVERPIRLSRAAGRLLSCLALRSPQAVSRARLAGWLHPDLGDAAARRALTDALYHLRRELAHDVAPDAVNRWLHCDAETIRLSLDHAAIDAHEFRRLATSNDVAGWQEAVALYRGDLLDDLDCEWAEMTRAELRELYLSALDRACTALVRSGDDDDTAAALALAQRWARADGLCEAAHCAVITLYARLGQYAHALNQYNRLEAQLRRDLDIPPMPETQALAGVVRKQALERAGIAPPARRPKRADQQTEPTCDAIQRLERAGEWRTAMQLHRRAGDRAETSYAHEEALRHYRAGLQLSSLLPPEAGRRERLALLCRRQRVLARQFKLSEWRADVDAIEQLTSVEPAPAARLIALEARIDLNALNSDVAGMVAAGEQAVALARDMNSPVAGMRAAITYGAQLSGVLGQSDQALRLVHGALARLNGFDAGRDAPSLAHGLCALAHAQAQAGLGGAARETALRALTMTQLNPRLYAARADALRALGCADCQLGDWQSGLAELRVAEHLHRDLGNVAAQLAALRDLAVARATAGQHAKAQADFATWFAVSERAGLPSSSDTCRGVEASRARALVTADRLSEAEQALLPLMDWMRHGGAPWPRARAWEALALLRLAQGRPLDARDALATACSLGEQWRMCSVSPVLQLAFAARVLDDGVLAEASLTQAEGMMRGRERAYEVLLLDWARYRVRGCLRSLSAARNEMHRQAERLMDCADRQAFLAGVPFHREIEAAWQSAQPRAPTHCAVVDAGDAGVRDVGATSLVMALARVDAPLGRRLENTERVHVRLTVDAGPHDGDVLRREGKAGLRRHRLSRLIEQARAQGAAPTDADLAHALNVNVRTIERDMAALSSAHAAPQTRRRAAMRDGVTV